MNIDLTDKEMDFIIRALACNYAEEPYDFGTDISCCGISNQILDKLIKDYNGYDVYDKARKSRYDRLPLNKNVFMGSGWYSRLDMNLLHKRLEFAFSELSAIQQNGGMGTEFNEQMDVECRNNIKSVIKDLMIALDVDPKEMNE